jgi:hypothetical protein
MKNKILTELFLSQELKDLLSKMNPDHLRDDLKQELFLALCETSEERIVGLHNRNELRWYTARIAWNMIASNTHPFYKKFRQSLKEYLEEYDFEETKENFGKNAHLVTNLNEIEEFEYHHSSMLESGNKALEGMTWYESELFQRYVRAGSAMKLIKQMKESTGTYIPKRTILLTVKKVREEIKRKIA